VTVLALPVLASCGVNFDAQTDQPYTPSDGENFREGTVDVLDALVVSDTPGSGRVIAGLVNKDTSQEDSLTGVQGVGVDQSVEVSLAGGDTTIPAGGLLQLANPDSAVVIVKGDPERLKPGSFVRLAFSFKNAETATMNIPVLAPGEDYGDVDLSAADSSSANPSESPSESPSASPSD
jgi:hypothetical protein